MLFGEILQVIGGVVAAMFGTADREVLVLLIHNNLWFGKFCINTYVLEITSLKCFIELTNFPTLV